VDIDYHTNKFGITTSSTNFTTTEGIDQEGRNFYRETTTQSEWMGGSLKVLSVNGTTHTWSADGYDATATFYTNYNRDSNGRLLGGSGGSTTTGTLADNGGTFKSVTSNDYMVKNGQLLVTDSTTNSTTWVEGQELSKTVSTLDYSYTMLGGQWRVAKTVSDSKTTMSDGSGDYTHTTTTKTIHRDGGGLITGMSQTRTGTSQSTDPSTGEVTRNQLQNYHAVFEQADNGTWYISSESYDWVPIE
jgi:hypothetical protein